MSDDDFGGNFWNQSWGWIKFQCARLFIGVNEDGTTREDGYVWLRHGHNRLGIPKIYLWLALLAVMVGLNIGVAKWILSMSGY